MRFNMNIYLGIFLFKWVIIVLRSNSKVKSIFQAKLASKVILCMCAWYYREKFFECKSDLNLSLDTEFLYYVLWVNNYFSGWTSGFPLFNDIHQLSLWRSPPEEQSSMESTACTNFLKQTIAQKNMNSRDTNKGGKDQLVIVSKFKINPFHK